MNEELLKSYPAYWVATDKLELNRGQIPGLPANPRTWTKKNVQSAARSLRETPELFEMRPCIAVWNGKKAVILCGSLRWCAAVENGDKKVPAILLPPEEASHVKKLMEYVIKDNGTWGAWDFDALANEWDDNPLPDWGVPVWDADAEQGASPDDYGEEFSLPDTPRPDFKQISFSLPVVGAEKILEIIDIVKYTDTFLREKEGDKNSNGIALLVIAEDWLGRLKENLQNNASPVTEEDLRKELCRGLKKSGVKMSDVDKVMGNQMSGHYFNQSQWEFPTRENFSKMQEIIAFERTWEDMRDDYLVARIFGRLQKKIAEYEQR